MKRFNYVVQGCASQEISNYDLEDLICKRFPKSVLGDSEHSMFSVFVTNLASAKRVLEVAKELGHAGELFHTYGAGSFPASFSYYKMDEPFEWKH